MSAALRREHARALLDALHPAQLAPLPAALVERARRSPLGRRQLARALIAQRPALLGPNLSPWEAFAAQHPWLRWPQARIEQATRELGLSALGPALRVVVQREEVLFLRTALGADAVRFALAARPWGGQPPDTVRSLGTAVLRAGGGNPAALARAVFERGQIEFLSYAGRSDARLAERLALAYAQLPTLAARDSWLPGDAVAAYLQAGHAAAEVSA